MKRNSYIAFIAGLTAGGYIMLAATGFAQETSATTLTFSNLPGHVFEVSWLDDDRSCALMSLGETRGVVNAVPQGSRPDGGHFSSYIGYTGPDVRRCDAAWGQRHRTPGIAFLWLADRILNLEEQRLEAAAYRAEEAARRLRRYVEIRGSR